MKLVCKELRIIIKEKDYELVMGHSSSYVCPEKIGYYIHKNRYYRYLITLLFVDYFVPIDDKIIKVGVKV